MKPTAIRVLIPAAFLALLGCRGQISREPPMWIKHGMEFQNKFLSFGENGFYADGRTMRLPPEGTVARGQLKEDDAFWRGGDSLTTVAHNPLPITEPLLERGRERFDIYCSPCHGRTGQGNGVVVQRGFMPPPNFHDDRILEMPDGQIYQAISDGVRIMPSYGKQIAEADRWAIVAYLRALQRSRRATLADVPEGEKANLR